MKGAHRIRRLVIAGVVAMLAVSAGPLLDAASVAAQASSEPGAGGYTPCETGQQGIDLLVMMDASGSLNAPASGRDRDGRLRRTALQGFREELTSLLQRLPADDAGSVRIALWRFESDVTRIVGFDRATASHPSDTQIEASLGDPRRSGGYSYHENHTDYLGAFRAAEQAFADEGAPDACRVLLFFSDGLHDPTGNLTLEQADKLRDEVCRSLKLSYERAGINTFSILLGHAFRGAVGGSDPGDADDISAEMAEASKQILRALTGHADSPLVRGLPYSRGFECERWSDAQPDDRDGSIIAVDDLDSLAIQLLEVAETAARQLVEWTDCGIAADGGKRSGPLPAGRYIETIVAYPRGSLIQEYEIVTADGQTISGPGSLDRPLYLESDVLGGLEAGWTLEFRTDGDGGIEVACYARRADPPVEDVEGEVTGSDGKPLPDVVRSTDGAESPPLGGVRIEAQAPQGLCERGPEAWPDERVRDWYCRSDGSVVFELHPLECQESYNLDRPLEYEFEPAYAEGLFGPGAITQQVRIEVAGSARRLYDCLGAPVLTCADETSALSGDGSQRAQSGANAAEADLPTLAIKPDSHELPRSPLQGISACRLYPPHDGVVTLRAHWRPDVSAEVLPDELDWRFDGDYYGSEFGGVLDESGRELRLAPGGSPDGVVLRFVTTDELANADWRIAGVIELIPTWRTGIADPKLNAAADELMAAQHTAVRADATYAARSDSGLARWLTLLGLLATLLLSYVLFCLALASTFGLADPRRFWWRHAVLGVERRAGSSYSFVRGAVPTLAAVPAEAVHGDRVGSSRRPRYTNWRGPASQHGADSISVVLRRSPRFWLFGLLRGPWSEVRSGGSVVAVRPKGRKLSRRPTRVASRAELDRLIVVGAPRSDDSGAISAPVWVAHPKSGPRSSPEELDERELAVLLNEAAELDEHGVGVGLAGVTADAATEGAAHGDDRYGSPAQGVGDAVPAERESQPHDGPEASRGAGQPPPRGSDRPPPRRREPQ